MLLDQTTLVLIVTNGDLIWTIGVSYVVHVRGYSGYTPCTPTSHVHILWSARYCTSLSTIIDEDEMWQGIKSARESNVIGNQMWHRVHRFVARDSRGVIADVTDLDYCLPRERLRWGYLSQGKGSLSSKLQSFFLPLHQKNERKHLELHVVVSRHHGLPPGPPLILIISLHQHETHCANANFW